MSTEVQPRQATPDHDGPSFAETALKLGGKSDDEARRTGAIDKADDQVERLFAPQYQTANSPAHRAVWERGVPVELFASQPAATPADVQTVMDASIARRATPSRRGHAAERRGQDRRRRAGRAWRCRLLGPAGRSQVRRLRRSVRVVCAVSHADGDCRSDRRRAGVGPRLHRRRRSGAHVRQRRAETRFLPGLASGERLSAFALDRALRRQRSDRPAHTRRARRRGVCGQRREAVHHQRRSRPHDRSGVPHRRQAGRADRRSAGGGERAVPACASTACTL